MPTCACVCRICIVKLEIFNIALPTLTVKGTFAVIEIMGMRAWVVYTPSYVPALAMQLTVTEMALV